jgi:hypothetical protein
VTKLLRLVAVTGVLLGSVHAAAAQTADEIVEKHLAAIGGRAALSKLTSRMMAGTIASRRRPASSQARSKSGIRRRTKCGR